MYASELELYIISASNIFCLQWNLTVLITKYQRLKMKTIYIQKTAFTSLHKVLILLQVPSLTNMYKQCESMEWQKRWAGQPSFIH